MEVIVVCLKYNTNFINCVSIFLSIIIVFCMSFGVKTIKKRIINNSNYDEKIANNIINYNTEKNTVKQDNEIEFNNKVEKKSESNEDNKTTYDWYIEIPKIDLYAPIDEGTNDEVLNRAVGHFEDTAKKNGNCGLAAHNRGYLVNYFKDLKELEKNDIIYYFVDNQKYKYKVTDSVIIFETDWSMLEDTEDNRITLITCVENREEYRLCVQGILINE